MLSFGNETVIAAARHGDAEAAVGVVELDWRNVIDDRHACVPASTPIAAFGAVVRFPQPHQVDAELEGLRLTRDNRNREPRSSFGTTRPSGISQAGIACMVAASQKKTGRKH